MLSTMSHELCHVCQLGDPFRINTDQVVGVLRAENEAYLLQGHKMAFLSETTPLGVEMTCIPIPPKTYWRSL